MTRYIIRMEVEAMQLPIGSLNVAVRAVQEEKQCVVVTTDVKEKPKGPFGLG